MRIRKLFPLLLAACASAPPAPAPLPVSEPSNAIPRAWLSTLPAAVPALSRPAPPPSSVRVVEAPGGQRLVNGEKDLTPLFHAIESFDVSAERKEVVFSAKRGSSFDVGLVSVDGSDVNWLPEEPADEVAVQWAPRGNKVSYVVRAKGGDVVRTVHIPTGASLAVDFPQTLVRELVWEPEAERYSVLLESADASPRVESVRYGGEGRKVVTRPAVQLDVEAEPLPGDVLLLRPAAMKYSERLPLVVWIADHRLRWDDARASLMRNARVAVAITEKEPDAAFWTAVEAIPWLDASNPFTVAPRGTPRNPEEPRGTLITSDPTVEPATFARTGRTVAVAPPVVKSFAAGYIAQQLKGNPPPNGRNR